MSDRVVLRTTDKQTAISFSNIDPAGDELSVYLWHTDGSVLVTLGRAHFALTNEEREQLLTVMNYHQKFQLNPELR